MPAAEPVLLQKVQSEIQTSAGQRQVLLKEIFSNDETSKTWASQPVPDAIRSMFNNTGATNTVQSALSSTDPVQ